MAEDPIEIKIHTPMTVEFWRDDAQLTIRGRVVNLLTDEIWLAVPDDDPAAGRLEEEDGVRLSMGNSEWTLFGVSTFRAHLASLISRRVIAVRRPEEWVRVQRRSALRLDVGGLVEIRVTRSASCPASTDVVHTVELVNLATGGVLVTTDLPLAMGDAVEVELPCGRSGIVSSQAEVVRVERPEHPHRPRQRVALRFKGLTTGAEDRIAGHLFEIQRQRIAATRLAS